MKATMTISITGGIYSFNHLFSAWGSMNRISVSMQRKTCSMFIRRHEMIKDMPTIAAMP